MFDKGVVLNQTYSNAIIRSAYIEGYIKYTGPGKSPSSYPHYKRMMTSGLNPIVTENALWAMLLFGTAHIKELDNADFEIDKLTAEDIVHFYQYQKNEMDTWFEPAHLKNQIITYLRNKKVANITSKQFDDLIEIASDKKTFENLLMDNAINRLSIIKGMQTSRTNSSIPNSLDILRKIMEYCYQHNALINYSKDEGIPGFCKVSMPSKYITNQELQDQPEDAIKVLQIALTDLRLPKLKRIDQVLELREDERISNFRNTLLQWAGCLKEGTRKAERKIRRDIYLANKELETLKMANKIGKIATVLGISTVFFDLGIFSSGLTFGGITALITCPGH